MSDTGPDFDVPAATPVQHPGAVEPFTRADVAWLVAYLPLALAFTWPLAPRFFTHLAGDHGDGWQNLWNIGWIARSLGRLRSPFFTPDLHHPDGVTLVFQTFDLPDALWSAPLLAVLPPVSVYNLVVLWTFVASGAAMYLLARGTGSARWSAFLAGCAYTFGTYHFGHVRGHLHIVAMQWVPLFVLSLWHLPGPRGRRWGVAGGLFLAMAALSSWYYLLGAMVLSAVLLPASWLRAGPGALRRALVPSLLLAATFLAIVGPLGVAMLRERAREPIAGEHAARVFSADLESFVLPNAAQLLGSAVDRHRAWTGNGAENASYLGFVLLALVISGLVWRAPRVGAYLAAALLGIVLALGPALHVGGRIVTGDVLPYAWLERWIPILSFTGVPVRLAFAATFGLAAALAPALDALASRVGRRAAFVLGALVLVEHVPHAFITSQRPVPAPFAEWKQDPDRWAVLDATRDMRHLWHQLHHEHPIVGGYVTRTPKRLEDEVAAHPVAGPLLAWDAPRTAVPFSVTALDFDFAQPVVPGAEPRHFSLQLTGTLEVTTAGEWSFATVSDDGSELFVDGKRVVDNRGVHEARERTGAVSLAAGRHAIRIRYEQGGGDAVFRAFVTPPGGTRRVLGAADVPAGFTGSATVRRRALAVPVERALERLRDERIRFVIVDAQEPAYLLRDQLGLPLAWAGDDVRIYEVPGVAPAR